MTTYGTDPLSTGTTGTTPGFDSARNTGTDMSGSDTSGTDTSGTAKQAASTAADQGKHLAGTTKDEALNVAGTAAEQARNVIGDARQQVTTQVNDQATTGRDKLSQTLRTFGDDLQQMAEQGPDQGMAVDLAREVSDRVRALGSHLEAREPGDLLADARDFARRRPGTFLLGALAAGVVAGRMFRATADGAAAASLQDSGPVGYGAAGLTTTTGTPGTSYGTAGVGTGVGTGPMAPTDSSLTIDDSPGTPGYDAAPPTLTTPSSLDPTESGMPGQRTQDLT
jgi:hypothetical protein